MTNYWKTNTPPTFPGFIGLETFWMSPDSQEKFIKNPRPGYTETSIIYKHNSHGFRSKEFELDSEKPSILCVGDSFTYGIGVKEEHAWPSIIAESFPSHNVYNLGIPGAAWDTITRYIVNASELFNTKLVLIYWPEVVRYELYHSDKVTQLTSHDEKAFTPGMLVDCHFENLAEKNQLIVRLLSKIHGYQLIEASLNGDLKFDGIVDLGRDNHFGPETHKNLANHFLKSIKF
jgi:hypothetical protein